MHLVVYSNEALVIVDGQETTALIDSGAQVSSVSTKFCCKGNHNMATGSFWSSHVGVTATLPRQTSSDKDRMGEGAKHSSQKANPVEVWKFSLDDIKGLVHTTQKVTILPFSTVNVHASTSVKGHCMWVHVLMELMPGPQLPAAVVPMVTYGELHPGSSRVPIYLCHLSTPAVKIPKKP